MWVCLHSSHHWSPHWFWGIWWWWCECACTPSTTDYWFCWSNTTDYVVELLLQLTCCVVDELGRWWLRVKKCCIMSARNRCIYTQIVWRDVTCVTVWHVTSNTYSTVRMITNMCLHYIWVEVPVTCAHSSNGSCTVHARLQQILGSVIVMWVCIHPSYH